MGLLDRIVQLQKKEGVAGAHTHAGGKNVPRKLNRQNIRKQPEASKTWS